MKVKCQRLIITVDIQLSSDYQPSDLIHLKSSTLALDVIYKVTSN